MVQQHASPASSSPRLFDRFFPLRAGETKTPRLIFISLWNAIYSLCLNALSPLITLDSN